jgi:hypothetical protein
MEHHHLRIAVLCALFVSGCGSSPAAPAVVPEAFHRVFGTVTNEEGSPIAGAAVVLAYVPDSGATQMVNGLTGADGRYEVQFSPNQPGNVNATIRASATEEYVPNTQLVRLADAAEKNIRLRRLRTITMGQSATVRFDADSSRCTKAGTSGICESLRIRYPSTFVERLEVIANGAGAVVPTLVGEALEGDQRLRFLFSRVVGQGVIVIHADPEWWDVYISTIFTLEVSIPDGAAPQQYEVMVRQS